jgi:hypothetical protein
MTGLVPHGQGHSGPGAELRWLVVMVTNFNDKGSTFVLENLQ